MEIDLSYIQHLAENHEGVDVEFKETTGQLDRGMETLCGMLNEVTPFFLKHLSVKSRMEGMYRKDELEVPITALRECCANALAHMDWRKTASVGVAIYDDRIEIVNAGMLPEDIPANQYGSHILDSHTSEPPNETIARVMYYSGVIEHWSRGLSMIFEECERAGLP